MKHLNRRGSALIYILIAIALIAALTAVFMQPASQQTRTQNSFKLAAELGSQVQLIRSTIQDCILQYPEGDNLIPNNIGYHPNYPMDPDAAYLDSPAADKQVANIRCPGKNPGTGHENEHELMFGGTTGRFMPSTPALFDPWIYRNGTGMTINGQTVTGVFFQISTSASDAYLAESMQKVDEQFTGCEADYIAGDGTNGCANGAKCLRIWIKRVAPTCP
jgi:type II secretory pathway pseudopilin PulG